MLGADFDQFSTSSKCIYFLYANSRPRKSSHPINGQNLFETLFRDLYTNAEDFLLGLLKKLIEVQKTLSYISEINVDYL